MEKELEKFYKEKVPLKEVCSYFGKKESAISSKAIELGLTSKYPKKNSKKFFAPYQNYEWCYQHYIVQGMSLQKMADELGCKKRVVQKWCTDIFGLHRRTASHYFQLTPEQYQIVLSGTLGDGHISSRDLCYIESHAVDEQEYLFWKFNKLQNLCSSTPTLYPAKTTSHWGKPYTCQPYYRYETRKVDSFKQILSMSRSEKIFQLSALGIVLYFLDDGSRSNSNWSLCVAMLSEEDKDLLIEKLYSEFNIQGHRQTDARYLLFDSKSSELLDDLILTLLPNDIDVIQKKIMKHRGAAYAKLP